MSGGGGVSPGPDDRGAVGLATGASAETGRLTALAACRLSGRTRADCRGRTGDLLQIAKGAAHPGEMTLFALPLARQPSSGGSCSSECLSPGLPCGRIVTHPCQDKGPGGNV